MVAITLKYRVNLYREREDRALRFRQGLVRGVALGTVVGLEFLLIAMLLFSGIQMKRQAAELSMSLARLETPVGPKPDSAALLELRTLVRARLARVDWASTLSAVSKAAPPGVVLTEVRGGIGGVRGRLSGIILEGRLVGSSRDLSAAFEFIEALKTNPVIAESFPIVDLGTAKGQGNSFQIICRRGGENSPS